MKIHDIKPGKNRFCGPAAVSAVTGRPVDEVVKVFHAKTPRTKVMGTHLSDLAAVLTEYGVGLRPMAIYDYADKRPTLAGWLKLAKADRTAGRVFLLSAGNHWVIVSGRKAVCGYTIKVVSVREYPKRRMRVRRVWELHENGSPRLRSMPECAVRLVEEQRVRARASSVQSSALAKVKAKAKPHGITIERENDYWLVWPPEGLADDPYEGDHICWDVGDVDAAVEVYIKALTAA